MPDTQTQTWLSDAQLEVVLESIEALQACGMMTESGLARVVSTWENDEDYDKETTDEMVAVLFALFAQTQMNI